MLASVGADEGKAVETAGQQDTWRRALTQRRAWSSASSSGQLLPVIHQKFQADLWGIVGTGEFGKVFMVPPS